MLLRLILIIVVSWNFVASASSGETSLPEKYVRTKGAVSFSANPPDPDAGHRAIGVAAKFLPSNPNLLSTVITTGEAILWDISTREIVWRKKLWDESRMHGLEVSPDGTLIFVRGILLDRGNFIKVLRSSDGETIHTEHISEEAGFFPLSSAHRAPLIAYHFGEKNRSVAWRHYSATNERIAFGDRGFSSKSESNSSYSSAISDDGKQVAMVNSYVEGQLIARYTLDLFDVATEESIVSLPRREEYTRIVFSPTGDSIAYWGGPRDQRVIITNLKTGEARTERVIFEDIDEVTRLRFSADGRRLYCTAEILALESGKPVPYVWVADVESGKFLAAIAPAALEPRPSRRVQVMDFDIHPDGKSMSLAITDHAYSDERLSGLPDFVVFSLEE